MKDNRCSKNGCENYRWPGCSDDLCSNHCTIEEEKKGILDISNIECDVCGSFDWNLKGNKKGIILVIGCRYCHNNITNLEDKVKNL